MRKIYKERCTVGALFPNSNFKSFSNGVRFRSNSKHITLLLLFERFRSGASAITEENPSFTASLCFLMCPPRAWPNENPRPQMEHSWVLGFRSWLRSPSNLGFLWLARWPPSAWNDENLRLHVLHWNSCGVKLFTKSLISCDSFSPCLFRMTTMFNWMWLCYVAKHLRL